MRFRQGSIGWFASAGGAAARRYAGRDGLAAGSGFIEGKMHNYNEEKTVPEPLRRKIFELLVVAQDLEMTVPESYEMIADRFGLSERQIQQIEREGLAGNWPPL
jgi:hypothetical protein